MIRSFHSPDHNSARLKADTRSVFFVFLPPIYGGPVLPLSSKSPMDETGKPNPDDNAGSREDQRRQLAELVGRLLARQWVDRALHGTVESSRPG